ncbi:MAG TPA: DUF2971 domain-containing protein, partial [Flavobacteriaceae bacterium]
FWASYFEDLNDPNEGLVTKINLKKQLGCLTFLMSNNSKESLKNLNSVLDETISFREKLGVYCLSKTFKDELMWAHYGNSHKGFCIEYDLNVLLENYNNSFLVTYNKKPIDLSLTDISNSKTIFEKIIGNKSIRWKYEQEIRILTDWFGKNHYNYRALKSIYFGLNMDIKLQTLIMNRLKGRGVKYFKIELIPNSYKFDAKQIDDINGTETTYLSQIPASITMKDPITYVLKEIKPSAIPLSGSIKVEIEKIINEKELEWISKTIRENLFYNYELVIIEYYLKNNDNYSWAITNYKNGKTEIKILPY